MDRDDIYDGAWHVEFNTLTVSREFMKRLRYIAMMALWRQVDEIRSDVSPIRGGVFYPLRPEDV